MRALKEEIVALPTTLAVDINHYQSYCETAFARLNEYERKLIFLRYWECLPIARIADQVGRSWNETNRAVDKTVEKIRQTFSELNNRKLTETK